MGKTIGIISTKGGVGKTSVVISLADVISDFGRKVLLIDGNLSSPNIGLHLNVINPKITLHHVLSRKANIKESVYNLDKFDLIPASIFSRIKVNPLNLKNKISFLKRKYDIVLLDSSPSLNEETLAVMLASDSLFVVTTPDLPTLGLTLKTVKMAKQRGVPIDGLILNKVYNKKFELSMKEIEEVVEVPILAVIPYDYGFIKAISSFSPLTSYNFKSKATKEFRKLAATLIGEKYKKFDLRRFLKIAPRKEEINREIFYERVFK